MRLRLVLVLMGLLKGYGGTTGVRGVAVVSTSSVGLASWYWVFLVCRALSTQS